MFSYHRCDSEELEKTMTKEIHFFPVYFDSLFWMADHKYLNRDYTKPPIMNPLLDYADCEEALKDVRKRFEAEDMDYDRVYVCTQMCFLDTDWLVYGFRIFMHDETGQYEIKLGPGNERTGREIKAAHNLFKMWRNGCFAI
jgi:hypothetical protein